MRMRIATIFRVCLACVVGGASEAEQLDGSYLIEFGYANAVWGPGDEVLDEACDADSCVTGGLSVDAAGVADMTVNLTFSVSFDGIQTTADLAGMGRGKAKGRNGVARLKVKIPLSGALHAPGFPDIPANGNLTLFEELNGIERMDLISGSLKLCAKGAGCLRNRFPPEIEPLGTEEEDGGPWTLAFELTTDAVGTITGGATATFPDGSDPIEFLVTGRYNAKTDESSLKLESVAPQEGASAKLVHVHAGEGASTFDAFRIKYKLCGQSGSLVMP